MSTARRATRGRHGTAEAELEVLRQRLAEAEETIEAIRSGAVDAVLVSNGEVDYVQTLAGADRPYRVLVETMQQGALVLALDGTVLFSNGRLCAMLGIPTDRLTGQSLSPWINEADRAAFAAFLKAGHERDGRIDLELLRSDATTLPVCMTVSRLPLGTTPALSLIVTDMTRDLELERLSRAHRESRASEYRLKETDRRKDDFLAEVAHELRNPLGPVRNVLEVLRVKGTATPDVEWAQNIIERQVSRMSRVLDELIDLSSIAQDRITLQFEPVDLAAVLRAALASAAPMMEEWGHEVVPDLPDTPMYLSADPARLEQVFANLLTNASNHTSRFGRIEVSARSADGMMSVTVRDNGAGITEDLMPHIFDMFSRVDRSVRGEQHSLGIGLALVRRLVELHGGTVEARSEGAGKGSEFIVRLPVRVEAAGVAGDGTPAASLRILVVDDSEDNADALGALLRAQGNEVRVAYNCDAALDIGPAFEPNVVLLDLTMPGVDGLETCRRIRNTEWGDAAHVIAVTGRSQSDDRERARDSGFDHHVTKPVDLDALATLLGGLASRRTPWPDKPRRRS